METGLRRYDGTFEPVDCLNHTCTCIFEGKLGNQNARLCPPLVEPRKDKYEDNSASKRLPALLRHTREGRYPGQFS